jgi:hypothetical protein
LDVDDLSHLDNISPRILSIAIFTAAAQVCHHLNVLSCSFTTAAEAVSQNGSATRTKTAEGKGFST